ncbi:hypothetical protein CJ030_MR5G008793 [Morella rubra]|uniref:Uncharacterized protein n=1 Tax=Morella rubra TaxID=262757 RepID=A0A6A1WTX1_9ROSI|nr:hypothetical protein CJ030_MR5G008793 [Morella rubra]
MSSKCSRDLVYIDTTDAPWYLLLQLKAFENASSIRPPATACYWIKNRTFSIHPPAGGNSILIIRDSVKRLIQ